MRAKGSVLIGATEFTVPVDSGCCLKQQSVMGSPKRQGQPPHRPSFKKPHFESRRFLQLYVVEICRSATFQRQRQELRREFRECLAVRESLSQDEATAINHRTWAELVSFARYPRHREGRPDPERASTYLKRIKFLADRYFPGAVDDPYLHPYMAVIDWMVSLEEGELFDAETYDPTDLLIAVLPMPTFNRKFLESATPEEYTRASGWGLHRIRAIKDDDWREVAHWLLRYVTGGRNQEGEAAAIAAEAPDESISYIVRRIQLACALLGIDPWDCRRP